MQGADIQVRKPQEVEVREYLGQKIATLESRLEVQFEELDAEERAKLRTDIDALKQAHEILFPKA